MSIPTLEAFDGEFMTDLILTVPLRLEAASFDEVVEGLDRSINDEDDSILAFDPVPGRDDTIFMLSIERPDEDGDTRLGMAITHGHTRREQSIDDRDMPGPRVDEVFAKLGEVMNLRTRREFHCRSTLDLPSTRYAPAVGLPLDLFRGNQLSLGKMTGARFQIRLRGFHEGVIGLDVSTESHLNVQTDFTANHPVEVDAYGRVWALLMRLYEKVTIRINEEDTDDDI